MQSFLPILLLTLAIMAPTAAQAGGSTKADEQAGSLLFRDKGCSHCHGVGGIGTKKGPALTSLSKDKLWTPEKITQQILNGGQKMPPFSESLTDSEAAQLVAYLRAKHKPAPPPEPAASPVR
jgi:mono/diheme cytochrome c family protein